MTVTSCIKGKNHPSQSSKPILYRLMIPLSVTFLLLILGFSVALLIAHQQDMKQFSQHIMEDAGRSMTMALERKADMLSALEDVILTDTQLYEALQAQNRDRLRVLYDPIFQKLQAKYSVTHFYFHLPNRVNLLRLHNPEIYGDLIDRFTAREAERSGKMASGIELGPLGTFTLRVVKPIYVNKTLIGYMELGQEIEGLLQTLHKRLRVELAVTIRKRVLERGKWEAGMEMLGREANWNRYGDEVLIYYSQPSFPSELDHFVHGRKSHIHDKMTGEVQLDNRSWRVLAHSLQDVSGAEVGDLLVFRDITDSKVAFFNLSIVTAGLALILLSALFVFFYVMLHRTDQGLLNQQAKLIESEGRQRSLLDAINRSGIFLFVVDSEYSVRYMNEAMRENFGNVTGKLCYNDVGGYDLPCSHCRLQEVIDDQKTVHYHSTLANNRTFNMIAVPYIDTDGVSCKLEVMQDITRQLQIEDEKERLEQKLQRAQKMEAIGLLAGGVAHDLNNILSGIVSYPELLLMKLPEKSELRGPLVAIQESGKRAAAVVEDLLTVARGIARVKEPHDLNLMAEEYLSSPEFKTLQSLYPHVTCQHRLEASHSFIVCSPVHIKKSLMNLVTNAAEAIVGEETIFISTYNQYIDDAESNLKTGEYIVLSVRDAGPGISDEDLTHIFEPFYTKKVMGRSGTGLGLAVVWNTVEEHKGRIFVESSEKGTHFQLYFPVSKENEIVQFTDDRTEAFTGNNEHILVVDDEPQLRDIASKMLQSLSYRVDSVCSGELAVKFVKENPVDLIVIDMLMEPGMNGRQTYEKILQLYPKQKAIVVSGFSENDDVKAMLQLGAGGFIKKPYLMENLGQAVKEALNS